MVLGILIGIGVSVVNTRLLGPQQYGDLKFLQNLFAFTVTFLTLGVFVSGGRLVAQKKNERIKYQIVGNLLLLATAISVVLSASVFMFSFFEEQLFHNELGQIIRIFSPLLFVFPFRLCLENIMEGDNRIFELSVFRVSPTMLYLLAALSFNYFIPLSLTYALAIQLGALIIIICLMIILIKPSFTNIKQNISYIWEANKTHGFQVYIGTIAGVATAHLGGLSIGYFIDNTNVGFFFLAVTITAPLTMIPNAVGSVFYKDFANRNFIPAKATVVTLMLSISVLCLFAIIIDKVILFLYSPAYQAVIPLVYWISIASVVHGCGDYLNRFIGAHGVGKFNRNAAILVGISNVIGYTILIQLFAITGAAITKVFSALVYLGTMIYYYKKLSNSLGSLGAFSPKSNS